MRMWPGLVVYLFAAYFIAAISISAVCAEPNEPPKLSYYLPDGDYDPSLPTPRSVLGYEVGEWHVRHDQLLAYVEQLAANSSRVSVETYGRTYENRRLVLLAISSPENILHLDEIRKKRLARLAEAERKLAPDPGSAAAVDAEPPTPAASSNSAPFDEPVVVWLGYSVHGNESSGSNASMLAAYHFAAARGKDVERLLRSTVILIDPCINPDGLSRFASWANTHRGKHLNADPLHREHTEAWPSGRTNHYWFDLNRDWLLLTHPSSRGRIEKFHDWMPNVLGDFHEMGTNSTYFFQPGVPTRQNPLTPVKSFELTKKIAGFHARALDALGSLYFSEELFDDFYFGKGSTYPDIQGCIGILFEQASARGHLQDSVNGQVSFPFTIRNQLTTSLSTVRGANAHRSELLEYQTEFFRKSLESARQSDQVAWVFGDPNDVMRASLMLDILLRHRIEVQRLKIEIKIGETTFAPESSYVVPLEQSQHLLVQALFERRTRFEDTTFYDVSTWTLPLAFDLPHASLSRALDLAAIAGDRIREIPRHEGSMDHIASPFAYLFGWNSFFAPRAANELLEKGVRLRVTTRPLQVNANGDPTRFDYGTIVVPVGIQEMPPSELADVMRRVARNHSLIVTPVASGRTIEGADLGSPSLEALRLPKPLLIVGSGVSAYEAGEIWHLLDQRFDMDVTLLDWRWLSRAKLKDYSHLILVEGTYSGISTDDWKRFKDWVGDGGVLVATRGASALVARHVLGDKDSLVKPEKTKATNSEGRYADFIVERDKKRVSGAIFEARLDVSHPLGYGYSRPLISVFRRGSQAMKPDADPYANVLLYTGKPLLSGYSSADNVRRIAGSAAIIARRHGKGLVVRMMDNPNFRGYWYGTNKLFLNALFFGHIIRDTSANKD